MNPTLKRVVTAVFAMCCGSSAWAADLTIGDRIERGWYASVGVSPTVTGLYPDDATLDQAISNTFYGVTGSLELCRAGVGTAGWLDLCAGGTGFISLGDATETFSQGGVALTSNSSMYSFGGYLKARAHAGNVVLAPYAGLRHINIDVDVTTPTATLSSSESATAVFGGAELGVSFFNERGLLALQAEAGRSISGTDGLYFSAGPVLRVKF